MAALTTLLGPSCLSIPPGSLTRERNLPSEEAQWLPAMQSRCPAFVLQKPVDLANKTNKAPSSGRTQPPASLLDKCDCTLCSPLSPCLIAGLQSPVFWIYVLGFAFFFPSDFCHQLSLKLYIHSNTLTLINQRSTRLKHPTSSSIRL